MAPKSEIVGMQELERAIKALGKVPQTSVTKAARAGARIALKSARAKAPIDKGNLRKGIILKRERRTKPGKTVFDVMMDPSMNDVFVKKHQAGNNHSSVRAKKAIRGDKARSYYPASMEYGFFAVDGRYVPGDHFLRNSLEDNNQVIEKTIVDVLAKDIEKAWNKG